MEPARSTPSDSLSIFFPVYNDWGTIGSMVALADRIARQLTGDYEILAINDASPDHSGIILDELAKKYPRLRVITHERNRGYGGALRSGFANARKAYIFYTDGDAQYDVRELVLLWNARAGTDLVNGFKIRRSDPVHRKLVGRTYHHFVKLLFKLGIRDVDCDFRLIRRDVFQRFGLTQDSGLICVELMAKIHRVTDAIREVPVHHYHRMHGRSQFFNVRRVLRVILGMIGLWWRITVKRDLGSPQTAPAAGDRQTPAEASATTSAAGEDRGHG
ncbi:MAG: glycosyltransferase [Candidatus Eisenbacteria bacterium]|nr:glycosyltransferase [Candidatus Eisenbacteria bacterium]